jgi:hypothetical protein
MKAESPTIARTKNPLLSDKSEHVEEGVATW